MAKATVKPEAPKRTSLEAIATGIIVEMLGVDENEVTPEASFVKDLGADSLDCVELVIAFEAHFDIYIDDEDAEKVDTFRALITLLQKKGVKA